MAIHPDILEQARRFHQAGKLAEAERAYQQILQANGHDAEVWYQLGDAVLGQGRRAEGGERLREAFDLQPQSVSARAGPGVTPAKTRTLPPGSAELRQAAHLTHATHANTPTICMAP